MHGLDTLAPTADRVAGAGAPLLATLGMPTRRAETITAVARAVADGRLRLEPGTDVPTTLDALTRVPGVGARTAETIIMRALHWPDAFSSTDASLQHAAGVTGARALLHIAERWRPWRGYAAAHLLSPTRFRPFASAG
jgi:AraC family transcriptional regulator of adaptative response / DNA-3-methyladenine glycosylase II